MIAPIAMRPTTRADRARHRTRRRSASRRRSCAAAPAPRARTARRARGSRGTCLGSRTRATAARCRRAARARPRARRHRPCSRRARSGRRARARARARPPRRRSARPRAACRARRPRAASSPGPCPSPRRSARAGRRSPCSAASVAPTFVPFESSTKVTPRRSATRWQRCGKPANVRSTSSAAARSVVSSAVSASAASAFASLCVPRSSSSARAQQRLAIAREPALAVPLRRSSSRARAPLCTENGTTRAMARTHRRDERIVGVDDGVLGRLQQLLLELGVELERAVAIEVIGRDVEHRRRERRAGCRSSPSGSSRSRARRRRLRAPSSRSSAGGPRLPPAGARKPLRLEHLRRQRRHGALAVAAGHRDDRSARAASANSSMSPITARPRRRASTASGKSYGKPRREQHAARVVEPTRVERLERDVGARAPPRAARSSPGGVGAAVDDAHALAARRQDSARPPRPSRRARR